MSQKLSCWQDGSTFPQEVGLYQRQRDPGMLWASYVIYSWFDGLAWRYGNRNKKKALQEKDNSNTGCSQKTLFWRGLIDE